MLFFLNNYNNYSLIGRKFQFWYSAILDLVWNYNKRHVLEYREKVYFLYLNLVQ